MKLRKGVSLVLRLVAAAIMLQTLYFKFTAQPESVYIFTKAGIEPWGRIGSGVAELVASILLLMPTTIAIGAVMAAGIMAGAIMTHLTVLGIEVQGDGGQLFFYALAVMVSCVILIIMHRDQLVQFKNKLLTRP